MRKINTKGAPVSIWGIPYPIKRPTAKDILLNEKRWGKYVWFRAIYKGKDAWTNAHLVDILRQPQYDDFLLKVDTGRDTPTVEEVVPENLDDKELTLLTTYTKYINGRVSEIFYFLENDKRVLMVDPAYYNYFKYFYPDCVMYSSGDLSPVVIKQKGEIIGLFLPIRSDVNLINEAISKAS